MNHLNHVRAFFYLMLAFVFLLVACNGNEEAEGLELAKETETSNDDVVKIKILYPWGEGAFLERYEAIDEKLEGIELEFIDGHAQLEPLQELNANNVIPDIILAEHGTTPLVELDMIQPLDELIEKHQFDLTKVFPSAIEFIRAQDLEGRLLGLPVSGETHALYYNKEVFDLFGVPYPSNDLTWNEIVDLARKMTAEREGQQYRGLEMGKASSMGADSLIPLEQLAVNLTDPETGEVLLTEESAVQKYLELMKDIYDIPGLYNPDPESRNDYEFPLGTVAMLVTWIDYGRWGIPADAELMSNIGIAHVPVWDDNPVGAPVDSKLHVINKYSEHQDEAFQVITEYLSTEHQSLLGANYAEPPVVNDPDTWGKYGTNFVKFEEIDMQPVFAGERATPPERVSKWDEYVGLLGKLPELAESNTDIMSLLRVLKEESEAKIQDAKAQGQ